MNEIKLTGNNLIEKLFRFSAGIGFFNITMWLLPIGYAIQKKDWTLGIYSGILVIINYLIIKKINKKEDEWKTQKQEQKE